MIGRIRNKALDVVQGRKPTGKLPELPTPALRSVTGKLGQDRLEGSLAEVQVPGERKAALKRDWPRAAGRLRAQLPELLEALQARIKGRPALPWHDRVRQLKPF